MSKKNLKAHRLPEQTSSYPMRLDMALHKQGRAMSRNKAEDLIHRGYVTVNGKRAEKPAMKVTETDKIEMKSQHQYVSRAADKLDSVSKTLNMHYDGKVVLDAGSSTGGFTEYALRHGAKKVIAVDVGTDQMHPTLRNNPKIELHEKTDIRDFKTDHKIDVVVADISFISLRYIMPSLKKLVQKDSVLLMMCKPQFEAGKDQVNKGVIKNSKIRRDILKGFETWLLQNGFIVLDKADSQVAGTKGNVERFYKLKVSAK